MSRGKLTTAIAIGLIGALMASRAQAQSASGPEAEISLLKQQLQLMQEKLDKLEKQTAANTTAAAKANAKVEKVEAKTNAKPDVRLVSVARCQRGLSGQGAVSRA